MPFITDPNTGQARYIPGVYSVIKVLGSLPGALPEFHVPIIVGSSEEGHPFNADASKEDYEADFTPFRLAKTLSDVRDYYGADSEIAVAFKFAKRHGLPLAYLVSGSALVRAFVVADTTATGQCKLFAKKWGAPGNHIKLKYASNILTITPVKRFSFITANVGSSATRIYVKDNSWMSEGSTYTLAGNATTNETFVVSTKGVDKDANGQNLYWIEIATATTGAFTTAAYGMVVDYDSQNEEVSPTFATGQAAIDWIRLNSQTIGATADAAFTNALWDALATATTISEISVWGTPTVGTSPDATSGNHDTIISDLDASTWDEFILNNQVIPQAFLIVDSSSTVHSAWRDFATAKRIEGFPVSMTFGCAWGDTVVAAGDSTDPTFRSAALNSENCMLVAGGIDRLGSYLSHAPAVFGRRIGGGLAHNLTSDELIYEELEIKWDERNSGDLTTLHKFGVCTYRLRSRRPFRFVISQGLSTLQSNDVAWNSVTNDTPLVMQRDLADFVDRVFKEGLDGTSVGANSVTKQSIAATIVARGDILKERRQLIDEYTIQSIDANTSGNGWDVQVGSVLPSTSDFVALTTNILVGDAAAGI